MFIRLIVLTFLALASMGNAQNISQIKRTNYAIYKLDKEIKQGKIAVGKITEEISKTNYLLTQKRQKLIGENNQFNVTVREISRMARHPKEAQLINDIITNQPPKNGVIIQGQKKLATNLQGQQAEIQSLLAVYSKNQQLLNKQAEALQKLTKKRIKLHSYQRRLLKKLNISDSNLRKRLTIRKIKAKNIPTEKHNYPVFNRQTPVAGLLVQQFGQNTGKGVPAFGIKILATPHAPVKAVAGGVVLFNSAYGDYGNMLIIEDSHNRKHLYAGLGTSNLEVGNTVKTHTTIGFLPNVPEPVLYYELRQNGQAQKPII